MRAGPPGEEEPPVSINLHEAAFQGDLRLIRGMLGQGVDPNDELGEEFRTPLHYAAQQGHSQVRRRLGFGVRVFGAGAGVVWAGRAGLRAMLGAYP